MNISVQYTGCSYIKDLLVYISGIITGKSLNSIYSGKTTTQLQTQRKSLIPLISQAMPILHTAVRFVKKIY